MLINQAHGQRLGLSSKERPASRSAHWAFQTQPEVLSFPETDSDCRNYAPGAPGQSGLWQWLWKKGQEHFKQRGEYKGGLTDNLLTPVLDFISLFLQIINFISWARILYLYFYKAALMAALSGTNCISYQVLSYHDILILVKASCSSTLRRLYSTEDQEPFTLPRSSGCYSAVTQAAFRHKACTTNDRKR